MKLQWRGKVMMTVVSGVVGALFACSSDPESSSGGAAASPESSFCSALSDAYATCSASADASCGTEMNAQCTKAAALLNPSVLEAATDCLKTGCNGDPLLCLGKALGAAKPSSAQSALATHFCESCATVGGAACMTAFFGAGKTPGLGVALLPFGDAPIAAVDEACTSNKLGKTACQAAFSACVSATATKHLAESISASAVACIVTGIKDGLTAPPGGGGSSGASGSSGTSGSGGCEGCAGCCQDGACESGVSALACGAGGSACETCPSDASCTGGKCVTTCGPDTCSGCCDAAGVCQTGSAGSACGSGGAACAACTGGKACDKGACIDPSCKASCASGCCSAAGCQPGSAKNACGNGGNACVDCGAGRTCSGGACVADAGARWDFVLVAAHLPAKNASGGAWDPFGGLPDAYALATSGATTGSTSGVPNTLKPTWNATALANVTAASLKAKLEVDVWDDDPAFDDHVGLCKIVLDGSELDGALRTATCPAAGGGVAFKLDYRLKAR